MTTKNQIELRKHVQELVEGNPTHLQLPKGAIMPTDSTKHSPFTKHLANWSRFLYDLKEDWTYQRFYIVPGVLIALLGLYVAFLLP